MLPFLILFISLCSVDFNTAFGSVEKKSNGQKHTFNQFQINVLGQEVHQGAQPPGPAGSGLIWVQLPASYFPNNSTKPLISTQPSGGLYQPLLGPKEDLQRPVSPLPNLKCLEPRGQFPSTACNKYVNCWEGVGVEQECPPGLVFNPKGFCDYSANVDCANRTISGVQAPGLEVVPLPGQSSSAPTTPTSLPSSSSSAPASVVDQNLRKKCLKPRGQFPSDSCNKFVNCWDDVIIEQECPDGLYFSSKQGYCDYPVNVDCGRFTIEPPEIATQASILKNIKGAESECLADFGTFRDDLNCSKYYTCIGGQRVAEYFCPEGFKFNDNIGVCDYENRVDCSQAPLIYNPLKKYLDQIPKNFLKGVDSCTPGSVYRLNQQCTAACICRAGITEIVECPNGLAYDSKRDKCILPQFAQC